MYKTIFQKHQFPKKFYDSYILYKFQHNRRYLQNLAIYLDRKSVINNNHKTWAIFIRKNTNHILVTLVEKGLKTPLV